MHSSRRLRRLRSLLATGSLLLLLLLALAPADGMLLATTFTLLVLLTAVVATHYRLETRLPGVTTRPPALASPLTIAIALTVVVVIGSLAAMALALLLSAVAKVGGDGRGLLRILLVTFALSPCLSIGSRCGRWWAFGGSFLLAPTICICILIVGPRSPHGLVEMLFVVAATGLTVALGSLQHRLDTAVRSRKTLMTEAASSAPASRSEAEPPGSSSTAKWQIESASEFRRDLRL